MFKAKAYFAASATSPLAATTIPRRDPTEHDVQIEILFCGICHSDLHLVRNEWSEFWLRGRKLVRSRFPHLGRRSTCSLARNAAYTGSIITGPNL
jgi:NADPH:quinone reductase-like Zn-dependent oxidoreductase